MIRVFVYYLTCATRNRVVSRIRRLKQPKYLVSAAGGLAYVYFVMLRPMLAGREVRARSAGISGFEGGALLETAVALSVLLLVLLLWMLPRPAGRLLYTEAEVQFLFSAPLSRLDVLNFRVLRLQTGVLFGILVFAVVFGLNFRPRSWPASLGALWLVYSFMALYRLGMSIVTSRSAARPSSGARRVIGAVAVMVGGAVSIWLWTRWFLTPPLPTPEFSVQAYLSWVDQATRSGPGWLLLMPFRALVHPGFSSTDVEFLVRLPAAILVLGLTYAWVVRSELAADAPDSSSSFSEARAMAGSHSRPRTASRTRALPFQLRSTGRPAIAILWKNLIASGRLNLRSVMVVAVALAVGGAIVQQSSPRDGSAVALGIGFTMVVMSLMMTVMGPVIVRPDLRQDLLHADVIKSWPLNGWVIVLGEVLAPITILAAILWGMISVAAVLWPGTSSFTLTAVDRLTYAPAAALVLPALAAVGVVMQNAITLILPGWVQLGREEARGIEASGQRMVTMLATVLVMALSVVPATLVFGVAFVEANWLLGRAAVSFAALAASAVLLAEAAIGVWWVGRMFDRLDVSVDHITES